MKVTNEIALDFTPLMEEALYEFRAQRAFNPQSILDAKVELVNRYFKKHSLKGAVIGVSGGIDSAVALGILAKCMEMNESPIERIIPLTLPALSLKGATGQENATEVGNEVISALGLKAYNFQGLSTLTTAIVGELEALTDLTGTAWVEGQALAYCRTPILYSTTSLLTEADIPSVVIGTTNLSEGGYLGYVGKASDGMTDVQIIADLFKNEVYALGELLKLPSSVMGRTPRGDMFDGRTDEELFGAPYDFVELYTHWLSLGRPTTAYSKVSEFIQMGEHLERVHAHNAHKYQYTYPSVFLNTFPCAIPGGWQQEVWSQ